VRQSSARACWACGECLSRAVSTALQCVVRKVESRLTSAVDTGLGGPGLAPGGAGELGSGLGEFIVTAALEEE
jgi:hypothetical protein